jgi:hypothetical protein
MYLDYRRLREEQLMCKSGPPCTCGRRQWSREPVRDPEYRQFRCRACLTVLSVPATLFHDGEAVQPEDPDHHEQPR